MRSHVLFLIFLCSTLFVFAGPDAESAASKKYEVATEKVASEKSSSEYSAWNKLPHNLDPTLVTFKAKEGLIVWGSAESRTGFPIRYYGLSYILAVMTAYYFLLAYVRREKNPLLTEEQVDGVLTWLILGIVLGARLGYVVFYNPSHFLNHPLEVLWPFSGKNFVGISGMSYHGGLIGATALVAIYFKREKLCFWRVAPLFFWVTPLAYTWGRLGNFMNGELYGRVTDSSIGMLFPSAPTVALRHPSQLYEAFSEGILLFAVLTFLRRFEWGRKATISLYLMGYSIARFVVEFFREPDAHIGLDATGLSRGQWLSIVMFMIAVLFWVLQEKTTWFTCKDGTIGSSEE